MSLHFKDLMLAMGMLKGFNPVLGMECAGVVEEVGPGVDSVSVGQPVICMALAASRGSQRHSMLGTTAVVNAAAVFPRPARLSPAEASGFYGVMATAYYALVVQAGLKAGETVLIHSAAGGVGQSAVQLAQHLGARVVASAGSDTKRRMLQERFGLPAACVIDSRNPRGYVKAVKAATGGEGVHVVLNSVAGLGMEQSLLCLCKKGRFVEIGKVDILGDNKLGLLALKENISLHSVHLDLLQESHPKDVAAAVLKCAELLESGELTAIETTEFPASQVRQLGHSVSCLNCLSPPLPPPSSLTHCHISSRFQGRHLHCSCTPVFEAKSCSWNGSGPALMVLPCAGRIGGCCCRPRRHSST